MWRVEKVSRSEVKKLTYLPSEKKHYLTDVHMAVFFRVSLFCRVFFSLPSGFFSALGKEFGMPSAIILPSVVSAALGKQLFCRVPDRMHSANVLALGKSPVSSSGSFFSVFYFQTRTDIKLLFFLICSSEFSICELY